MSDEAKDYAMNNLEYPDYALMPLIEKADAGYVVWDSAPPTGVNFQTHKFSLLDAILLGLSYCRTNTIDDWAVLGGSSLAVIRTLPHFAPMPEKSNGKLTQVGMLNGVKLFAYPDAPREAFWMGHANQCCRGTVQNLP